MRAVTRLQALLIVFVLWAAIFLPGLGSTEIKGEEGRRILPAITMLEGGSWLVPFVGGKPFLRKPPLVNWLIAFSFKVTGVRNEWTARLPSAICVLMLGLTIVALSGESRFGFAKQSDAAEPARWMDANTALAAALFAITPAGLLAKARFAGAEIEGIYVPLCGMAMVCWMAWWTQRRSPWLTWTVPFVFLGLAMLAKAPLHLLFFYGVCGAVLWRGRALRELVSAPHLAGVLIMCAIFAAWAVPYFQSEQAVHAGKVWRDQFAGRVAENVFSWKSYLTNLPRGLVDQLPWVLFAPLLFASPREAMTSRLVALRVGSWWATLACFFGLMLVPGVLPRYVLPLGVPLAVLLALRLAEEDTDSIVLKRWHRVNVGAAAGIVLLALLTPIPASMQIESRTMTEAVRQLDFALAVKTALISSLVIAVSAFVVARRPIELRVHQLAIASASLFGCAAVLYAMAAVRWIRRADNVRPIAARIDAAIPSGRELVIYDPGYLPAVFYLRTPHRYAPVLEAIPENVDYVLARGSARKKITEKRSDLEIFGEINGKDSRELLLFRRRGLGALNPGNP